MPRIRTLKPEFWSDEKLSPLPPIDRLVFLGLISLSDDAGRLLDNVKAIDGFIFPETDDSAKKSLEVLAKLGRIIRYRSASGQKLIEIANWGKHQKIDKPSKYTLPGPATAEEQEAREDSASESRDSRGEPSLLPTIPDRTTHDPDLLSAVAVAPRGKKVVDVSWMALYAGVWDRHFTPGLFEFGKASRPLRQLEKIGRAPEEIADHLDFYFQCEGIDPARDTKFKPAVFRPDYYAFARTYPAWDRKALAFPSQEWSGTKEQEAELAKESPELRRQLRDARAAGARDDPLLHPELYDEATVAYYRGLQPEAATRPPLTIEEHDKIAASTFKPWVRPVKLEDAA